MTEAPETVLVVDDEPANRQLVESLLTQHGYIVLQAADGEEALEIIDNEDVDLVVLDVNMPQLDGFTTLERLREQFAMTELPVIMFTARSDGDDVIQALRLGANDYATKPADLDLLLKRVRVHLALVKGRDQLIGPYRVEEKIGAGGMGVVFSARHVESGDLIALKVLPRSLTVQDRALERFYREARLAMRVDHPNVVRMMHAGQDDEVHYIVMELVEGEDLRQARDKRAFSQEEVLDVAMQLVDGLAALHEVGVIHRDIKPENVLLTSDGTAKIMDLGIAREEVEDTRLTGEGVGIGSVLYASPEQLTGRSDFRSDIYSLGTTLFFLITGEDPYPVEEGLDIVLWRKTHMPLRPRHFPRGTRTTLRRLVVRMAQPKPSKRHASFDALRLAIAAARSGRSREHGPPPWIWGALAVGVAAVGVLVWFWVAA